MPTRAGPKRLKVRRQGLHLGSPHGWGDDEPSAAASWVHVSRGPKPRPSLRAVGISDARLYPLPQVRAFYVSSEGAAPWNASLGLKRSPCVTRARDTSFWGLHFIIIEPHKPIPDWKCNRTGISSLHEHNGAAFQNSHRPLRPLVSRAARLTFRPDSALVRAVLGMRGVPQRFACGTLGPQGSDGRRWWPFGGGRETSSGLGPALWHSNG